MNHFKKRVVIAGGSGDIGRALIAHLNDHDYRCVVLSRSGEQVAGAIKSVPWLGADKKWQSELEGAMAVVNLCGETVGQKWTEENKKRIVESRVVPTRAIGDALNELDNPPRIWINASAVGIYGDTGDDTRTEESPPGSDFMATVCKEWEAEVHRALPSPTLRTIARLGVVLDPKFGYLQKLIGMTKKGFGGRIGSGENWISWIHIADLVRSMRFLIEEEKHGAFNVCSPEPVQQKEFSRLLVKKLGVPFAPPAPEFAVKLGAKLLGVEPEMILSSSRVVPNGLLGAGFDFEFESIDEALDNLLGRLVRTPAAKPSAA